MKLFQRNPLALLLLAVIGALVLIALGLDSVVDTTGTLIGLVPFLRLILNRTMNTTSPTDITPIGTHLLLIIRLSVFVRPKDPHTSCTKVLRRR
nr:hypothetical protein 1 - Corynebacterium glutamicum [Corynebacterium glutamicum]